MSSLSPHFLIGVFHMKDFNTNVQGKQKKKKKKKKDHLTLKQV